MGSLRDSGMVRGSKGYGPAGAGGKAQGPKGNQGGGGNKQPTQPVSNVFVDPQQISINQMQEAADIVAAGGENPYSGGNFGGNRPTMSEALVSAAPEVEEEQETTNSIFDALFNKNLKFQYDPVADYVNRVYGRMNPVQKKRMLAKLGYDTEDMSLSEAISTFGGFLDSSGQALYDAGNLQFSDLKNPFEGMELKAPTIPSTVGGIYDAIVGGMAFPYVNPIVATFTGNPLGMFIGLTQQEGPFQMDEFGGIEGEIANLQNAPPDYLDAVAAYNVGAPLPTSLELDQTGLNFTPDQVAQISMGEALRAEEQQATRGPADVYIPPSTSTTSGAGFQKKSIPGSVGTGTATPTDYQGIYNNFSADQKATADKIMAMDEYDLAYAVDYVRMGGPLF